jgi:inner membrane protein
VLALFGDNGLGFRRGITHGIPALILWPFVLTGILVLWNRAFPRHGRPEKPPLPVNHLELLKLSALAIITHPTLDWMNVYGMRWLMPFDGTWTSADALFIVDPWLYLMLGAAWIVGRTGERTESSARPVARDGGAGAVYIVVDGAVGLGGAWRRVSSAWTTPPETNS